VALDFRLWLTAEPNGFAEKSPLSEHIQTSLEVTLAVEL
jgi:hypothetical protein